jgi:hypothetical protein
MDYLPYPKMLYRGGTVLSDHVIVDGPEQEAAQLKRGYERMKPVPKPGQLDAHAPESPDLRSAAALIGGALGALGIEASSESVDAGLRALSATIGTSGGERDDAPEIPVFIAQQPAQKPAKAAQKPAKA